MLIEFSIGNFRSIKDIQTLSFVATPIKDHQETHTFQATDKIRLLKSAAIYGANGSGKSNLVRAISEVLNFLSEPLKDGLIDNIFFVFFAFDKIYIQKPFFFQIIFIVDNQKYRYGFEIFEGAIFSEWLFGVADKNEVEYFTRAKQSIKINKNRFKEGNRLEDKTTESNLFLNVVAAFNGTISQKIKLYFRKISILSGLEDTGIEDLTFNYLEPAKKKNLLNLLKIADLGIDDISEVDTSVLPKNIQEKLIKSRFDRLMISRKVSEVAIHFQASSMESEGTIKMIKWAGLLLRHLETGGTLFIDEFDARFHPILTKKIVELFNSSANKNAQLFFVTHDTHLLDNALLRRDQIYFAEKNPQGATEIYALSDVKGTRNDASFEKDYIKGKYGAIPYVGDFTKLFNPEN